MDSKGCKKSRRRILKNGVPQGSVLALALFNVYNYDLPTNVCKKYVYADDLALANSGTDFKMIDQTLTYFKTTSETGDLS